MSKEFNNWKSAQNMIAGGTLTTAAVTVIGFILKAVTKKTGNEKKNSMEEIAQVGNYHLMKDKK